MALLQGSCVCVVTVNTEARSVSDKKVWTFSHMRRMAGITLALFSRGVCDSILPITIDVMAAETQARLFLQQIGGLVVAMRRMTGVAVQPGSRLMGVGSRTDLPHAVMAGQTDLVAPVRKQGILLAGMRLMTAITLSFLEWLVPELVLPLQRVLLVATATQVGPRIDQEIPFIATVGLMTAGTVARHKRGMLTGIGHLFGDLVMTTKAEFFLRHGQQAGPLTLVRLVTGQTVAVSGRGVLDSHLASKVCMTLQAQLLRIACHQ